MPEKRKFLVISTLVLLLTSFILLSCASAGPAGPAPEDILRECAGEIALKIPPGSRIAITALDGPSEPVAAYLREKLAAALSAEGMETAAGSSLDYVRRETDYVPASGKAGLQAERALGYEVGAEYIISGDMVFGGSRYRLGLDLIHRETGKKTASFRYGLLNSEELRTSLAALEEGPLASDAAVYGVSGDGDPGPETAGGFLDRGMYYAGRGELEAAIAWYSQVLSLDPASVQAYFWRGHAAQLREDYGRALEDYARTAELEPGALRPRLRIAELWSALGEYTQALTAYSEALRLAPRDAALYSRRGTVYGFLDDFDSAIADFTQAIKLEPRDPILYVYRGEAQVDKGNYDRGIADFTQALKLDPSNAAAYHHRGVAHSHRHNVDQALADFTESISLDPENPAVYNLRGIIYANRHDNARAVADFAEAHRLEPDNQLYSRNLQAAQSRSR